ncbi:MAG: acyl-CoA thioesterase [Bacteroidia bacterium]
MSTFSNKLKIRVRYGECDQMGYLHHSNYARYYEAARVELMRSLGFSYAEMERSGIIMPVLNVNSKFKKPILYDELVTVVCSIDEVPKTRMKLSYEVYNESDDKANEGSTDLCFVDSKSRRPIRCPEYVHDLISKALGETF